MVEGASRAVVLAISVDLSAMELQFVVKEEVAVLHPFHPSRRPMMNTPRLDCMAVEGS